MAQTFKINNKFKTQLITAILSSPIVYIPHFNYAYIDKALTEICNPDIIGLIPDNVAELTENGDLLDFATKRPDEDWDNTIEKLLNILICNNPKEDEILKTKSIFLIKNFFAKFSDAKVIQRLQYFAAKYEQGEYDERTTLILVSPHAMEELPPEIEKLVTVVELPRPTDAEIMDFLSADNLPISRQFEAQESELRNALTRTLQGLQQYEVEQIIHATKVRTGGRLTEKTIKYALEEKKSIVKKSGIIEVVDTDVAFDQVGGLENLRDDLKRKASIFRHLDELSKVKLPLPKGILVMGMPGCGKSLIAKSIANEFGVSLLRLDVNRLMGQYVGQSEGNLRKALATAEAAHPCVLWIDEIEKAFAGANGGGGNDIVMRLMGHFLTWMQERKTAVYIVATANDVMRPEFMRKGRFDEVYFVDFPTATERIDILKKKIDHYRMTEKQKEIFDLKIDDAAIKEIAEAMHGGYYNNPQINDGFSGSEIQAVVESVMEKKYIEYLEKADANKLKNLAPEKVTIEKKDFIDETNLIKPSVMANQKGKKDENGHTEKTSVERIRDLQAVYKFRSASKTDNK
ncbi:MAG: AAA family ATPase [Bacteroidales bacterium]|nr:AAA family ATPase [Bacteroidales bacterium]